MPFFFFFKKLEKIETKVKLGNQMPERIRWNRVIFLKLTDAGVVRDHMMPAHRSEWAPVAILRVKHPRCSIINQIDPRPMNFPLPSSAGTLPLLIRLFFFFQFSIDIICIRKSTK